MTDELHFVARLAARFGAGGAGEVWLGDDSAVVRPPAGRLLLAVDPVIEDVHFDGTWSAFDVGWYAVARNVSDVAAMGGRPLHLLVSVVAPSQPRWDLDEVVDGVAAAAEAAGCRVVGGDTSGGAVLVVTVAVTGAVDGDDEPVLRSGAGAGDVLFVSDPLGATTPAVRSRVAEGTAARQGGATAMIDISDGLPLDLRRLATASGVGVVLDADLPVLEGRAWDDGEGYQLLFAAPDPEAVASSFARAGLDPPIVVGRCVADPSTRRLGDGPLPEGGWTH